MTKARIVEAMLTILCGVAWTVMAVMAFGAGERHGPVLAFLGMLVWASTVKEAAEWEQLARKTLALLDAVFAELKK